MKGKGNEENRRRPMTTPLRNPGKKLLSARGPFSHSQIWELGDRIIHQLRSSTTAPALAERVRKVWLEMGQNILRYGLKDKRENDKSGISMELRIEAENLLLRTTNLLAARDAQVLARVAARLNSLDRPSLEVLFDRQLQAVFENSPKPLSLGLIRIIRFSGSPLRIHIRQIDARRVRLTIGVRFA